MQNISPPCNDIVGPVRLSSINGLDEDCGLVGFEVVSIGKQLSTFWGVLLLPSLAARRLGLPSF